MLKFYSFLTAVEITRATNPPGYATPESIAATPFPLLPIVMGTVLGVILLVLVVLLVLLLRRRLRLYEDMSDTTTTVAPSEAGTLRNVNPVPGE